LLDAIAACEREAAALVGDLSDEDVNWQQRPGRSWSVAQCLDHLSTINPYYLRGFARRLEDARREGAGSFQGLSPTAVGQWFINTQEPPVRRRMKAPGVAVPKSTLPRTGLVEAFVRSHDLYRGMVGTAATVDVNRVTAPNPFLKFVRMRMSTVLLIVPAHDRRHLWQAQNVKRARTVEKKGSEHFFAFFRALLSTAPESRRATRRSCSPHRRRRSSPVLSNR
jgi:DinB superfamily